MKSQVDALLHVMLGICKDVRAAYPALRGLSSDEEKLALYVQTRGLGFFTLDLPCLDSILLNGLKTGRLILEGPLTSRVSANIQVPRFLSGLWLRVFDTDACLRQEFDATAIFFLRQIFCLGKRIAVECSNDRINATVGEYHDIERHIRLPSANWRSDEVDFGFDSSDHHLGDTCFQSPEFLPLYAKPFSSKDEEGKARVRLEWDNRSLLSRVQQVADLVMTEFKLFEPISQSEIWESESLGTGLRHGPGAVAERLKGWEKSTFPNWPHKLDRVFPFQMLGKTSGSDQERPLNREVPARLICVPKTAKSPRLIAAEPTSHQYCQQMIWRFMKEESKRLFRGHFLDFADQSKSHELVRQASLDGSLSTVDLSSASDRLSCWVVERMFRRNKPLLYALHSTRTRCVEDTIDGTRKLIFINKFASQGTASTFPVQSFCFLFIALAASIEGKINWRSIWRMKDQVRVYGDDIIVPTHGYARLVAIMDLLGLKVNEDKTFFTGNFRESCGYDAFKGYDVTPVKPKTLVADSPTSCQAVIDTINNLFNKGLWNASDSLRSHLPPHVSSGLRIVGINDVGYPGLTSFTGGDERHLRRRWNSRFHRDEVRVWSISPKPERRHRGGYETLLEFFSGRHNPSKARDVSEYVSTRKTRDGLLWEPTNPDTRVHAK